MYTLNRGGCLGMIAGLAISVLLAEAVFSPAFGMGYGISLEAFFFIVWSVFAGAMMGNMRWLDYVKKISKANANAKDSSLQLNLNAMLILFGTIPIWLALIVIVPSSNGWGQGMGRFLVAPISLVVATIGIHRLLRGRRNAWLLSALLAGTILLGSLSFIAWQLS